MPDRKTMNCINNKFDIAIKLFNNQEWYKAHDVLEEIWHNTNGLERITIQGILQIAVAQVHLGENNYKGATILYGEGLGRLKTNNLPDLGLDIKLFIEIIEVRFKLLQNQKDIKNENIPYLQRKPLNDHSE